MDIEFLTNNEEKQTIIEKTDRIIINACSDFYNNKGKFIEKIKKNRKKLNLIVHSFLLKKKLFGLSNSELTVFQTITKIK